MSATADRSIMADTSSAVSYIATGPHNFFIPVMGTGFTIDTPLRVAQYGISSVVSIGDDVLIEQVRKHYSDRSGNAFVPIKTNEEDSRVRRIRTYLDFLHDRVQAQIQKVRSSSFEPDSEITRYFDMLPDGPLKTAYNYMTTCPNIETKTRLQESLRTGVVAGNIDVNIMTKVDREQVRINGQLIPESGLAMTALRGFATSKLRSSIVLSAGINKRLFSYMATFDDFFPTAGTPPPKTIILKVSDYRSAHLQGMLLAKHGLWVSEYRIESGLNCGGHAFATKGQLMGPVLEEFLVNRTSLASELTDYYFKALNKLGKTSCGEPDIIFSAQGGVGTPDEHKYLLDHYNIKRVGWGTPFLFVPQATNVDLEQIKKLTAADENDIALSEASPLGVPFWILKNTASEQQRKMQISKGTPGRCCTKHFLASDSEFSATTICKASKAYQHKKLKQLDKMELSDTQRKAAISCVLAKTCLCMDLAGGALNRLGIGTEAHTAVCCGLSAADFDRVYKLKEMIDHIYGRSLIRLRWNRPNMFVREASLYVEYLRTQLTKNKLGIETLSTKYFNDFALNLLSGIKYYRELISDLKNKKATAFLEALSEFEDQLLSLVQWKVEELSLGVGSLAV